MDFEVTLTTIFVAALITALATGLGAVPFAFTQDFSRRWLGLFSAVAGGLMMSASHGLVSEGEQRNAWLVLAGMALGLILVVLADRWIERRDSPDVADLSGADARKALLILGVMTAHSFAEGIGVGVSFGGSSELGLLITVAIAVHNIPEGLAISLVLIPRGTSVWKAAGWSIVSSLPQPLMAIPAFLFVTAFQPFLPVGMGIAAGAMIWMVFSELVPDSFEHLSTNAAATTLTLAFMTMMMVQLLLQH